MEEQPARKRVVGWLLLLGSPGLATGLAVTALQLIPTPGPIYNVIGFGGLGLAGAGPAIGAILLAPKARQPARLLAALAAAVAGAAAYLMTGGAAMEAIRAL